MTHDTEVARIILGDDDFNGLDAFFEEALASPHAFKVAMARRCFNLCHVLKGDSCMEGEREVITDNALLLYADDFAEHFVTHGWFPSVLLFDDILLYGRAVYNALYRMEEVVFDALERRRADIPRRAVHEGMFAAVDIRVYALGNIDDVIDSLYLYKVSCITHRYGSDMLQLSRNVSEFLNYCGDANTSFLLSAQIEEGLSTLKRCAWSQAEWSCGGSQGLVLVDGYGRHMRMAHGFVRGADSKGPAWVTGFPCAESTAMETLVGICTDLANWIKDHIDPEVGASGIMWLLQSDNERYVSYKMQFVALLASAESVWRLLGGEDFGCEDFLSRSDIARICRHFGKGVDFLEILEALLRDTDRLCEWAQRLYDGSECIGSRRMCMCEASEPLVMRGEDLVCKAGMLAEKDAYDIGHRRRTFAPLSGDSAVIPLGKFLDDMRGTVGEVDLVSLACEMSMQHRGVNSMGYDVSNTGAEGGRVDCYLKAGELATHMFPQRHRYVLPALAYIEMATRTFPGSPEQILGRFVRNLPEDSLDGVPMPAVIRNLKTNFPWYAGISFYAKKGMSRWAEVYRGNYKYFANDSMGKDYKRLEGPLLARAGDFVRRLAASL